MTKQRMTVSVDPELIAAGAAAVAAGSADSMSAWVNETLTERVAHDRRLAALAEAVAAYEAEHGVITDEELAEQARADCEEAATRRAAAEGRQGAA